jgi:CRP/FNR family transcriptional regulator, cyclic AMP receptor protein
VVQHQVLRGLSDDEQRAVLASARRRRYARNEVIFHEGEPGETLHLLAKGRVAVQTTTPMGDTVIVNVLGPGDSFGEVALVDPKSCRIATIRALEAVETLSLSRAAFDELRQKEPAVNQFLLEVLAEHVIGLNERLREAYFVPVETRVTRCLVRLGRIYGDGGKTATVPLNQDTIATMVGATRPSVNRVLRQLEGDGLICLSRGSLELTDRRELASWRGCDEGT